MRALVTGAEGFVGPHLVRELWENGYEVSCTYHRAKPSLPEETALFKVDIRDRDQVRGVIEKTRPEAVFHLAALAHPAGSFEKAEEVFAVNVGGTKNLLAAVAEAGLKARVLLVGSQQEYGFPRSVPIREDHPLNPLNPYAESKVRAEAIGKAYADKLPVFLTRSFNHTGPGQPPHFVLPAFARQAVAIERGLAPPVVRVGNIDVKRDFLHVRDVVRAYRRIVERGKPGEVYNVSSGDGYLLRDLLNRLLSMAGVKADIVRDPRLFRPGDPPVIIGDRTKITAHTGWEPQLGIEQILNDLLEYWRGRPDVR